MTEGSARGLHSPDPARPDSHPPTMTADTRPIDLTRHPGLREAAFRFRLTVAWLRRENAILRLARRLEDEAARRRATAGHTPGA